MEIDFCKKFSSVTSLEKYTQTPSAFVVDSASNNIIIKNISSSSSWMIIMMEQRDLGHKKLNEGEKKSQTKTLKGFRESNEWEGI